MIDLFKAYKNYRKYRTHKALSNISKYHFHTFEFIKINQVYKKVNSLKHLIENKETWMELFKSSKFKFKKIDYFIKDKNYKKFLLHKTIGTSYEKLSSNKNKINGSIVMNVKNVIIKDNSLLTLINKNLSIMEIYGDDLWLNFRLNKWPTAHNYHLAKIKIADENLLKRIKIYKIEKKLKKIKKKAILLSSIREDNFFHWIFDTMIKLKLLENDPSKKKLPIILRDKLTSYQKKMLNIFGVNNKIIFTNGKSFEAKNIIIPTTPSPPVYSKSAVFWLRKKFLDNIKKFSTENKRIYISRSDASHRKIINDAEVSNFLKKYDFKTLVLSDLTLEEQINNFRCADMIILPHGSGASHLLFAKKNCKVIELQSPSQINNMFCCLSKIIGCKYGFLVGEEKKSYNFNYYIDIKKLQKLLNKAI